MEELQQVLITGLVTVLTAAIGLFVNAGVSWIRAQESRIKLRFGEEQYWIARSVIESLVKAAEQLGLIGELEDNADAKLNWVINRAVDTLQRLGVSIPLNEIRTLIEAAIRDGVHKSGVITASSLGTIVQVQE